jgi:hypothetical protein
MSKTKECVALSILEREEIVSVGESATCIKDVILWFGPNPDSREVKVRISNKPNDLTGNDIFSLILPEYNILGTINKEFITDDVLSSIIEYIEFNKENIYNYSIFAADGSICAGNFILALKTK